MERSYQNLRMLVLFDIDATLIFTQGTGRKALTQAGVELYGKEFAPRDVVFAGSLDSLILDELLKANNLPVDMSHRRDLRAGYGKRLDQCLGATDPSRILPGIPELLDALDQTHDVTYGLLTGNFPETGVAKLTASGIDPGRFKIQVWGDDSPCDPGERADLPPVAIQRYEQTFGSSISPRDVLIIGDTEQDVRCARVNGCRSLAVATGYSTFEELENAGADRVVRDLSETDDIVSWISTEDDNCQTAAAE